MSKIGVGVIGASPLRPGWAVTAHLPALLALSEYELRAVATSSEASAKAAGEAYGVPAYAGAVHDSGLRHLMTNSSAWRVRPVDCRVASWSVA